MSGRNLALMPCAMLAIAGLVVSGGAAAQTVECRLCSAPPAGTVVADPPKTPIQLELQSRLDFDRIVFDGDGTASVSVTPDGAASIGGSGSGTAARAMPGSVLIRGEPGRLVRVDLPRTIVLTGSNGGQVRLDDVRTDLPAMPRIGSDGSLSFRFGGKIQVSGAVDGAFRGDFPITVDYP